MLAAAFAWVLAQPPLLPGGVIGAGTPTKSWTVLGSFASREACEQSRASSNSKLFTTLAEYQPDAAARRQQVELAAASRCIERDLDATADAATP